MSKKLVLLTLFLFVPCLCQEITSLKIDTHAGIRIGSVRVTAQGFHDYSLPHPLFSVRINSVEVLSTDMEVYSDKNGKVVFVLDADLSGELVVDRNFEQGWKAELTITNNSSGVISIADIVPLGRSPDVIHITATGPWSLTRAHLFRPGYGPVGVILPDNAWELGFGSVSLEDSFYLNGLARRIAWENAKRTRWDTQVEPGGTVTYVFYFDVSSGIWQNGLRQMFQQHYLFDLSEFDESLYQRKDLAWIRDSYMMSLIFAWDHEFYDMYHGGYQLDEFIRNGKQLFGGWDIIGLWSTWPTLGLDQRNQWDLYRDLPGGLDELKRISQDMHGDGIRFFVAYNPWDEGTRRSDPYTGLADLIAATDADGVVLDTRGKSSYELQVAADKVKPGVIMYSEGMAVPRDMPGIVSGRVHDAIFLAPPLNLNKLIRPDFSIFRVCQLSQGRLNREVAVAFFNGYGIEINQFGPGRENWIPGDYKLAGRLIRILRENSSNFKSKDWTPVLGTMQDSIWVNRWPGNKKTLYTILSFTPKGFNGLLFQVDPGAKKHFVSLYRHEECNIVKEEDRHYVKTQIPAFDCSWLGSRREGKVDCIACLQKLLDVHVKRDSLFIRTEFGDSIRIWAGSPTYAKKPAILPSGQFRLKLTELFGRYEGKFVIQLFMKNELIDEVIQYIQPGTPLLVSKVFKTMTPSHTPLNMRRIPAGYFYFQVEKNENFIPYPDFSSAEKIYVKSFYMDIYPVTNTDYKEFIDATHYEPKDTTNFLKHWQENRCKNGEETYPVVYVSREDAQAYARWCGKRLPTEIEWQYAAQGTDGRIWPWGNEIDSSLFNVSGEIASVSAFPNPKSKYGIQDLVGNVWQLTNDVYDNGSHYFIIIRGGSYYNPTSSMWYVKGGPQPLNRSQMLLRISPGFERNATVGFRCVRDAE